MDIDLKMPCANCHNTVTIRAGYVGEVSRLCEDCQRFCLFYHAPLTPEDLHNANAAVRKISEGMEARVEAIPYQPPSLAFLELIKSHRALLDAANFGSFPQGFPSRTHEADKPGVPDMDYADALNPDGSGSHLRPGTASSEPDEIERARADVLHRWVDYCERGGFNARRDGMLITSVPYILNPGRSAWLKGWESGTVEGDTAQRLHTHDFSGSGRESCVRCGVLRTAVEDGFTAPCIDDLIKPWVHVSSMAPASGTLKMETTTDASGYKVAGWVPSDGVALTSAAHPEVSPLMIYDPVSRTSRRATPDETAKHDADLNPDSLEHGEMDRETGKTEWRTPRPNELAPAVDAAPGSLHWVEMNLRLGTSNGDVPAIRTKPIRAVWMWTGSQWRHDGVGDFPSCAYLAGWRYLHPAFPPSPQPDRPFLEGVLDDMRNFGTGLYVTQADGTNRHIRPEDFMYDDARMSTPEEGAWPEPSLGTGNTHLRLAALFAQPVVTPEMREAGLAEYSYHAVNDIGWPEVESIYRAMHAVAPVPLVSEAEDKIAALQVENTRLHDELKVRTDERNHWRQECTRAVGLYETRGHALRETHKERDIANGALEIGRQRTCDLHSRLEIETHKAAVLHVELIDVKAILGKVTFIRYPWPTPVSVGCEYVAIPKADYEYALRKLPAVEQPTDIDYNGPVKDGRAIPDPVHEQFHRAVGDVLSGKVMPAARRQMQEALKQAPKEPVAAPDAILRGNKAPVGMLTGPSE